MGVTFDCPHCRGAVRIGVWFSNPIDGGAPYTGNGKCWSRAGETFVTLTLSPSIDVSTSGHWHGHIVNGEVT